MLAAIVAALAAAVAPAGAVATNAHSVAVDPRTHLVYLPLRNVRGRPVLRIMAPV